jgi:hypothetical protein
MDKLIHIKDRMGHELDRWENEGGALSVEDQLPCICVAASGLRTHDNVVVYGTSANQAGEPIFGKVYQMSRGDAFSETFIAGLRRDISRWKAELSMLDAGQEGNTFLTSELRSWIGAGEAVFARYEKRRK